MFRVFLPKDYCHQVKTEVWHDIIKVHYTVKLTKIRWMTYKQQENIITIIPHSWLKASHEDRKNHTLTKSATCVSSSWIFSSNSRFLSVKVSTMPSAPRAASTCAKITKFDRFTTTQLVYVLLQQGFQLVDLCIWYIIVVQKVWRFNNFDRNHL